MNIAVALALGVIVGAALGFPGGRRFERFHRQYSIARAHAAEARELFDQWIGSAILLVIIVAGGVAVAWAAT